MTDHPMVIRQRAVEACVKRFDGQRLDFKSYDCVRLARLCLVKQGVTAPLLKGLRWASKAGAEAAMSKAGVPGLMDGMDALGLARIAPAAAWQGDIVGWPSPEDDPFGCSLMIALGNSAMFGLDGHGKFRAVRGLFDIAAKTGRPMAAWRVLNHG